MSIRYHEKNRIFHLCGGDVSYVLHVTPDGKLMNLYWGKRLAAEAIDPCLWAYKGACCDLAVSRLPHELPVFGTGWYGVPAVDVRNAKGDNVVSLEYVDHVIYPGKKPLDGLPATYVEREDEADSLEIALRDPLTGLRVTAVYGVFADTGAITRSLRIENGGPEVMTLGGELSASVPLYGQDYDLIHLKGGHERERMIVRTPVGQAEYRIFSQRGASGHEENPFMALCEPSTTEHRGEVWAVNLVYSGSFQALAYVDNYQNTRLSIGLNPEVFSWQLEPGEAFIAPEAVMVWSDGGLSGMSHMFHRLYRERLVRGTWRDRERPILINTWEAVVYDFDEQKLLGIADAAADLGIELFVLDDGWFGQRDDDNISLGDWTPHPRKFPNGLRDVVQKIKDKGLGFGLWFEPEMVSPDSDLYRAHPDWCLHVEGRERTQARNQLILDLSRREVQDYVIEAVSGVLRSAPIDYVKWDMNRNMTEAFSGAQTAQRQMETQHRYMLGLYRVLESICSAFPNVLFESCASGGGRFDPGMLYYMPQVWTSDNTDAIERLYIQYGTSLAYPAVAMGAHVSKAASTSLAMRGHVAMGGNFGFELNLTKMTDEESAIARGQVELAKRLRSLTQRGEFTRLLSPFGGNAAAWQFVSQQKDEALLCVYRLMCHAGAPTLRIRLLGLEDDAVYRDENGNEFSGSVLMRLGMWVDLSGRLTSKLIHLRKVTN